MAPDDLRGTRALRLVEDIRRYTQAPIIVVAHSLARASDRIAFLRRGADDVLVQATPLVEIRERVRRHAVRAKLIPPVTSRYLRLEVGADLPRSGEYGTVQWGVFKENLENTIEAMRDLGGHFALLGIQVTDADPNGAPEAAAGVARKVTQELVQILRDEDAAAIAPDGLLVVRLHTASQREVQFVLQRAAT
ncbi:MAG: hypothetical protein FJ144_27755, partial [Deltaproteobacteria bacterium]|nr:hypothetical protein [Deltaproteobacteria bacterium]